MSNISKKIEIFLADGYPKGIRFVSIFGFSIECFAAPRNRVTDLFRENSHIENMAAVYFLIGESEEGEILRVYVGEADGLKKRLKNHENKDWWSNVVAFYSKDNKLDKAHIEYLEKICIDNLKKANICQLENSTQPSEPSLMISDKKSLEEYYYKSIELLMPILGYDIFPFRVKSEIVKKEEYNVFCKEAQGIYTIEGKLIVLKNSHAAIKSLSSLEGHPYKKLRDHLINSARLIKKADFYLFMDDYTFEKPSAAASVILGRPSNGRNEWKTKDGVSINDLESNI
jgi:hypothetical protein